jgi:hypothetical protein
MGVRTATEPTWPSTETDTLECSGRSRTADPGCLSRIPDPDFYLYRIQQRHQEMRQFFLSYYFFSHKYHKIVNNFIFEQVKNHRTFYPKICHSVIKNMGLGSGIPDPGSKRYRIRSPVRTATLLDLNSFRGQPLKK